MPIRGCVKPRIRDCNKTTDVRTTDSRTGIVPRPLTYDTPLTRSLPPSTTFLFPAFSAASIPPFVRRFLPPMSAVFSILADQISLSLFSSLYLSLSTVIFLCTFSTSDHPPSSSVFLRPRTDNGTNRPASFPLEKWKLPGEVTWSSEHEFPVTFRNTSAPGILPMGFTSLG